MKKLLMAGAILVMGAMAYGTEHKGEADVKVRAEITADDLIITDLNGNPIVLDFGKISNKSTGIHKAEVGYKVTWGKDVTLGSSSNKFKMELGGQDTTGTDGAKTVRIYYNDNLSAGAKETSFDTIVGLDKYSFDLKDSSATQYTGKVLGTINTESANATVEGTGSQDFSRLKTGVYEGNTTLTVTLTTADA